MNSRSQTATEYLIIIAVVIIIALIVVSVLGGIPSIGGGASSSTSEARLKSLGIGVENYAFSNESGVITVKNNKPDSVSVSAVYVDGKECGYGTFVLSAGQSRKINCSNITNSGENYEYAISMNWTDVNSGAKYVDSPDVKISGDVVSGLNTNVGSSGSSGSGGSSPYVPTYLLTFTSPTPNNGTTSSYSETLLMNVSIPSAGQLETLSLDWNGTNVTSLFDSSLILMYNFDNVSSLGEDDTKVVDMSFYSVNGSVQGDATYVSSGVYGGAYSFDGSGDYLNLGNQAYLDTPSELTVSVWAKFPDYGGGTAGFPGIVSNCRYGLGSPYNGYRLSITRNHPTPANDGSISFSVFAGGTTVSGAASGPSTYDDDSWHHYVGVYKPSLYVALYVDGQLVTNTSTTIASIASPSNPLSVGRSYENSNFWYFEGQIDDLRIYNRSFSSADAKVLYETNLQKYNSTQWYLYMNKTNITAGDYTYQVNATFGDIADNSSEKRVVTIS